MFRCTVSALLAVLGGKENPTAADLKKIMGSVEAEFDQDTADSLCSALLLERERSLAVMCDEVEDHVAVVYCTVCGTHLCQECSLLTHNTRTLNKHKRIPLSEKPREKPLCSYHTSHVMEFTCLEPDCRLQPLMCYICKDYGRHKGHKHNLLELEAEQSRGRMVTAVQKMKKFMEEMGDTTRKMEQVLCEIRGDEAEVEQDRSVGTAEVARRRVRGEVHTTATEQGGNRRLQMAWRPSGPPRTRGTRSRWCPRPTGPRPRPREWHETNRPSGNESEVYVASGPEAPWRPSKPLT